MLPPKYRLLAALVLSASVAAATPGPLPAAPSEDAAPRNAGDPLPKGAKLRLGTTRLRHGRAVNVVTFSPDGKTIASAGSDRKVRLWAVQTGKLLREWEVPTLVSLLAFSPDGKLLAASSSRGPRVWDVTTGKERWAVNERSGGTCLTWSPDGKTLASGWANGSIRLHEGRTGKPVRALGAPQGAAALRAVGFSADGKQVLSVGLDQMLRRRDAATGKEGRPSRLPVNLTASSPRSAKFSFSRDGKTLVVVPRGHGTLLCPTEGDGEPRNFPHRGPAFLAHTATFSSCGRFLATGSADGTVSVRGVASGRELRSFAGQGRPVAAVALSPDGRLLAAGRRAVVELWDVGKNAPLHNDPAAGGAVNMLAFLNDGKTLVTAADDALRAWNLRTGRLLDRLPETCVDRYGLAVTSGGKAIRTMVRPKRLLDWEPGGKGMPRTLVGHILSPLTPDGTAYLQYGPGRRVQLYDLEEGKAGAAFAVPPASPGVQTFSSDGRLLAAATVKRSARAVHLWNVRTGQVLAVLEPPPAGPSPLAPLYFSPGARTIIQIGKVIKVWEVLTGKERTRLPLNLPSPAVTAAVAPDGRSLVLGLHKGEVLAIDLDTGKEIVRLAGHEGAVRCLGFSPDGRLLASGAEDTITLVWDAARFRAPRPEARQPTADDIAGWWAGLAAADAKEGYAAVRALGAAPMEAVALFREKLKPASRGDARRIAALIDALEDDNFQKREEATRELAALGKEAEAALRQALGNKPLPETKRRAEDLLGKLGKGPSTRRLREARAVEVLERLGSEEARAVLTKLARGTPNARLTRAARSALARLERR